MRKSIMMLCVLLVGILPAAQALDDFKVLPISADSVQLVSTNIAQGVKKAEMRSWKMYVSPDTCYEAEIGIDSLYIGVYVSTPSGLPDSAYRKVMTVWIMPLSPKPPDELISWVDYDFSGRVICICSDEMNEELYWGDDVQKIDADHCQQQYNDIIRKLAAFFQKK